MRCLAPGVGARSAPTARRTAGLTRMVTLHDVCVCVLVCVCVQERKKETAGSSSM